MKNSSKRKRAHSYTEEDMQNACDAVKEGNLSVGKASTQYGIPKTTLSNRLQNKQIEKSNTEAALTREEELRLEKWLVKCSQTGFSCCRLSAISAAAKTILEESKRDESSHEFNRYWYASFNKRHPNVRKAMANRGRAAWKFGGSELQQWYHNIGDYLFNEGLYNILEQPERVFYCMQDKYEDASTLVTFSASAQATPPLLVLEEEAVEVDLPKGWLQFAQAKCEIDANVQQRYLEDVLQPFLQQAGIEFPIIIFYDQQKQPPPLRVYELCQKLDIILLNTYHMAFYELRKAWKERLKFWYDNIDAFTDDHNICEFVEALKDALVYNLTKSNMKQSFKSSGLYPFDMNAIDKTCLQQTKSQNAKKTTTEADEDNSQDFLDEDLTNAEIAEVNVSSEFALTFAEFKGIVGVDFLRDMENVKRENYTPEFIALQRIYERFKETEKVDYFVDIACPVNEHDEEDATAAAAETEQDQLEQLESESDAE